MTRAARLDPLLYREVADDKAATSEAILGVVLVAVDSGIGNAIASLGSGVFSGLASGIVSSPIGWAVMSFVTYLVVRAMFGSVVSYLNLLRPLGFARSPKLLTVFGFVLFFDGYWWRSGYSLSGSSRSGRVRG